MPFFALENWRNMPEYGSGVHAADAKEEIHARYLAEKRRADRWNVAELGAMELDKIPSALVARINVKALYPKNGTLRQYRWTEVLEVLLGSRTVEEVHPRPQATPAVTVAEWFKPKLHALEEGGSVGAVRRYRQGKVWALWSREDASQAVAGNLRRSAGERSAPPQFRAHYVSTAWKTWSEPMCG